MPISLKAVNTGGIPALRLNGLQNGWSMNTGSASTAETTVTYTITTTLSDVMSITVPAGKTMILTQLWASSGLSTSQLLTCELEVDGSTVLSGTVTPNSSSVHFIGSNNISTSYDLDRVIIKSNFKLKVRTASGTQASIPFRYRYFLV